MIDPTTLALISVGLVFALIVLGVHIGVALAAVSVLTLWGITGKFSVAASLLQTTAYSAVMDYVFAVVPLFVLMGLFSTLSGATRELFSSAQVLLGGIRGGLGIATVFANAVFAAITGVSVASAAVFSKIA
ncbi:MAG: TRAP transporter large permease subunit, partial [Candidatus Rokubacteria bacterium]|nr:TRAP transporter large permease subunit [Candidatus Rokubacteria bacterium]